MNEQGINLINIRKVLEQKAPSAAKKIPDFLVNYLVRTVHQDELNDIILRYHDKYGVDFMESLLGYFDLKLDIQGEENLKSDGRFIFASNHPLGGMDGICLSAYIGRRYDGKIRYLVNDLLLYLQNLQSILSRLTSMVHKDAIMLFELRRHTLPTIRLLPFRLDFVHGK